LKFRRRHADTTRKKRAEAAEAGETDCHANVSDRQIGENQQVLGFLDLCPRAILVRGLAKDGLDELRLELHCDRQGESCHSLQIRNVNLLADSRKQCPIKSWVDSRVVGVLALFEVSNL